jgi:hypothetical protein
MKQGSPVSESNCELMPDNPQLNTMRDKLPEPKAADSDDGINKVGRPRRAEVGD